MNEQKNTESLNKMRWVLFWVFTVAFAIIVLATLVSLFTGVGAISTEDKSFLLKVFIGEIGISVVALFYALFGLKKTPNEQSKNNSTLPFFKGTYPHSQDPNFVIEIEKLIPKSKKIVFIATGLSIIWNRHIVDVLIEKAVKGKIDVTICLANPLNPNVERRLIEEEIKQEKAPVGKAGIINIIKSLCQRLNAVGNPSNFRLCLFENYPTIATMIFDDDIFIYPYIYRTLGNLSPVFHFKHDDSEIVKFYLDNASRIVEDAIPANNVFQILENRQYFSDNWFSLAVYFIPDAESNLYKFGSQILGYDIYQNKIIDFAPIEGLKEVVGEAQLYAFHSTIADGLFFVTTSQIEKIKAELRYMLSEMKPFKLSNLQINGEFTNQKTIVISTEDNSGQCELIHFELINRVYKSAISSNYLASKTGNYSDKDKSLRSELLINKLGSPYIMKEFRPHFTLCSNVNNSEIKNDIM